MKRALVFAVILVGVVAAVMRFAQNKPGVDWEKRLERMPDNAPPKWIFRNVTTIRENTERILDLLERQRPDETGPGTAGPEPASGELDP